ncbi:MAG TPA: carboxypeptidase-like regulatory domain-containing protein [Candidatus Acidoferrales bacterium]|nr:carboxypeptidase-like regulatory domain-containing protein [Candidatus Acidoferrales bacterium]
MMRTVKRSGFVVAMAQVLTMAMMAAVLAVAVPAQDKDKETQVRTVHGTVVDKDGNNVTTGVVYLKNLKTQDIRTYISDETGQYRFSGLNPNVDYEIHAERNGEASSTKKISSFDSRKDIVITLKLDQKKSGQ